MKKPSLLVQVVLAIALGLALGSFAPAGMVKAANTFNCVFGQFIRFMVPLIIVGLVTPAIAETGRSAGRMLLATVAIAYCSTLFAGFLGYFTSVAAYPGLISAGTAAAEAASPEFPPYMSVNIPPPLDVMSSLVLSFIVGLGTVVVDARAVRKALVELREIVTKAISAALVPLLPLFIFGIFADMAATGKAKSVLLAFAAIIAIFSALTLVVIFLQFLLAGVIARKNPFKAMWTMLPAYMTALGTSSSAATIPVTRAQTLANGVRREVADFVIPLCATVHLAGSTVKLVSCAVALTLMSGKPVEFGTFAAFVFTAGVVMVAAPGVPGGAVMSAIGILESMLGFDQAQIGLMISIYLATDSVGTACNITGDGAIALVIDRMFPASPSTPGSPASPGTC